jgi:hypothetical protein
LTVPCTRAPSRPNRSDARAPGSGSAPRPVGFWEPKGAAIHALRDPAAALPIVAGKEYKVQQSGTNTGTVLCCAALCCAALRCAALCCEAPRCTVLLAVL